MPDAWDALPDTKAGDAWDALPDAPKAAPATFDERYTGELPQAFLSRLAHGEAIKESYEELAAKPYSQRLKEWAAGRIKSGDYPGAALGTASAFIAGIPEVLASGIKAGGDVLFGHILTGAGLRKEDFSDDPNAPDPLEALISRASDMAMTGGVRESSVPKVTFEGRAPLLMTEDGNVARPYSDREGAMRADVIGKSPQPVDFRNAAEVIGGKDTEANLRQLWEQDGTHPSEAAVDAQRDTFARHDLKAPKNTFTPEETAEYQSKLAGQSEGEIPLRPVGAEVTDPPLVSLAEQPPPPPGRLGAAIHDAGEKLFDIGRDVQMLVAPMVRGAQHAMAIAKDFANTLRRNRWEWSRYDADLEKNFKPEQRERMWNAADEESVLRQEGKTNENMGLATLEPAERAAVEDMQARAQSAWVRARDLGMVEGEGLPAYTPRMVINVAGTVGAEKGGISLNGIGHNLKTSTSNLLHRKYLTAEETEAAAKRAPGGAQAELARDIRTLPLATARLEDAIAGRTLINNIKDYGRRAGSETVSDGGIPAGSSEKWFTIDHPAFKTWRNEPKKIEIPAQGKTVAAVHETVHDPGLQQGLERVATELGVTIKQPLREQDSFLNANQGVRGYTSRAKSDVVSVFGNAQTVLEHEIGHKIDFRYGLSKKIHAENPAAWKELGELGLHRVEEGERATIRSQAGYLKKISEHREYSAASSYRDYLLSAEERIANMFHAYWYAPKLFEKVAPNAAKWLENFLAESPDALKAAIKSVEPSLQHEGKSLQQEISVMSAPTSISVDQWKQVPIYVHGDFEGPLKAVLSQKDGPLYRASMSIKAKTMSLIMNSPLIHNAVEWGRALPAMPGKVATFKVYFEGNRVKNDVAQMREAIDAGMVPIGKRFFNQDLTSIMEAPNLKPGRSLTSDILSLVPGLFDEGAGTAVKRAVDKAGDFWHNTLLWDRIGDLQAGLYANFRDDLLAKGVDRQTAARVAAHFSNRFAGSLPQEAMSNGARKAANFLMFSRTFTLGNLGVMKDAFTGMPKDVLAQIERDMGTVDPKAAGYAKSLARRKAIAVVATDIALMHIGNSVLQSALSVMRGDSTLDEQMHGYVTRLQDALTKVKEHPLALLQPLNLFQSLSATGENEPGRGDRVLAGYTKDGTAIYARNPVGKIGEEFEGYMTGPLDMMRRKMGTIARPLWQIMSNDKGFGRKVYDPNADSIGKYVWNAAAIAQHLVAAQLPEGQLRAAADLVQGEGDSKLNALQAFGPIAGVTFSKGAPGGPAVGELYHSREMHEYQVQLQLPDIRKQIARGDLAGASQRMDDLGIPRGLQRFYVKTTLDPSTRLSARALRDFYRYSTPEQRARMERMRQISPLAPAQ